LVDVTEQGYHDPADQDHHDYETQSHGHQTVMPAGLLGFFSLTLAQKEFEVNVLFLNVG